MQFQKIIYTSNTTTLTRYFSREEKRVLERIFHENGFPFSRPLFIYLFIFSFFSCSWTEGCTLENALEQKPVIVPITFARENDSRSIPV